jgi:histidinol-phosphate aminotransferase
MKRIWRETLRAVTPYEAGKSLEVIQEEMGLASLRRLSANENPLGPSPKVVEALRKEAVRAHLYPDGGSTALREAIGRKLGILHDRKLEHVVWLHLAQWGCFSHHYLLRGRW